MPRKISCWPNSRAVGQMTGEARHIMGLLSDFFVAGVVVRAPSTADCDYPIFYQAPRVTDTTSSSFVLRLLFVLLDLSAMDLEELLRDCKTEVAVPADASPARRRERVLLQANYPVLREQSLLQAVDKRS